MNRFRSGITLAALLSIAHVAQAQGIDIPDDYSREFMDTASTYFLGTITYQATSEGTDSTMVEMFRVFASQKHTVAYEEGRKIRVIDSGGMFGTDMIIDLATGSHYQLDHENRVAMKLMRGGYFFPETILKPRDVVENINGYPSRKYLVEFSPFVRRGAIAYVWITDSIRHLRERGEYRYGDDFRGLFPLPMILEVEGTVMKMEVNEGGVRVIYTAQIDPRPADPALFRIPEGYAIKE